MIRAGAELGPAQSDDDEAVPELELDEDSLEDEPPGEEPLDDEESPDEESPDEDEEDELSPEREPALDP